MVGHLASGRGSIFPRKGICPRMGWSVVPLHYNGPTSAVLSDVPCPVLIQQPVTDRGTRRAFLSGDQSQL